MSDKMSQTAKVTVEMEGLTNFMRDYPLGVTDKVDRALKYACEHTVQDLKDSLEFAVGRFKGRDVGWTGALYNSIEARNTKYSKLENKYIETEWQVVMWNYGWDLDSGSTGETNIRPGTKLATWAAAHELWGITSKYSKRWEGKTLHVKPHPFIDAGKANVKTYIKQGLSRL